MELCKLVTFVWVGLIILVISIFGLIGNTASLFLLRSAGINRVATFFLQALAIADNLVMVFGGLGTSVVHGMLYGLLADQDPTFSLVHSLYVMYVHPCVFMAMTASMWMTVLLAVNRYVAICFPLKARQWCTMGKSYVQVAGVFVVAVAYNVPRFFQWRLVTVDSTLQPNRTIVDLAMTDIGQQSTFHMVYDNIVYNAFFVLLPLLFLVVSNAKLIVEVRASSGMRRTMVTSKSKHDPSGARINVLMVVIILIVIICQLPNRIYIFARFALGDGAFNCYAGWYYFSIFATTMLYLNSSINFVVYVWYSAAIRKRIAASLPCRRKVRNVDRQVSSSLHCTQDTAVHDETLQRA